MRGFVGSPTSEPRGWCAVKDSADRMWTAEGLVWWQQPLERLRQLDRRVSAVGGSRWHYRRHATGLVFQAAGDDTTSAPVRTAAQRRLRFFGVKARLEQIVLYYSTGWKQPMLRRSLHRGPWEDVPLAKVASSSGWFTVSLELDANDGNPEAPCMEFVVTDGSGSWDKPASGGNYALAAPGRYTLRHGKIESVQGQRVLLVSDLDGTMVGDDTATDAFKRYWEQHAVVRGSALVYNTGRSLASFQTLLAEKAGVLPCPDVLISAVGTKIYTCKNGFWVQDQEWAHQLDKNWRMDIVREAAYSALAEVGKEAMHFRPPEEQNNHKVTCGVHADILSVVLKHIDKVLSTNNVKAKLITSGSGDWRFLDIVSTHAGKLESLDYVRKKLGFPSASTVACGDSGNDILMLSGSNLAVVVGNAHDDLKEWVAERKNGRDGSRMWISSKPEALGILDGLEHFGFG